MGKVKLACIGWMFFCANLGALAGAPVKLAWDPSTGSSVTGYHVYRSLYPDRAFSKLNTQPVLVTSFEDSTAASGDTYYYACTAVSSSGLESEFSNVVAVTLNSVCLGDTDLNGQRNITDAIRILNFITGKLVLSSSEEDAADVDKNGKVDVLDAVRLMNALVGNLEISSCQ